MPPITRKSISANVPVQLIPPNLEAGPASAAFHAEFDSCLSVLPQSRLKLVKVDVPTVGMSFALESAALRLSRSRFTSIVRRD